MLALTADQLAGWMDYASREPFGFPIEDVRAAMAMSVAANVGGGDTTHESFLLGPTLINPPDEDGEPSADSLTLKLKQLLPPAR